MRSGFVAPVVLTILDGWGHREENNNNAICNAHTPVMDALWQAYPHTLIEASGSEDPVFGRSRHIRGCIHRRPQHWGQNAVCALVPPGGGAGCETCDKEKLKGAEGEGSAAGNAEGAFEAAR